MHTAAGSIDSHYLHGSDSDLAERHELYQPVYHSASSFQGPLYDLNPPPPSEYSQSFSLPNKDAQRWTGGAALSDYHQYPGMSRHNALYTQTGESTQSTPDYYADQQSYYFHNGIPKSGPVYYISTTYQGESGSSTTDHDHHTIHSPPTPSSSPPTTFENLHSSPEVKSESAPISCTFSHYVPPKAKTVARKKKPAMACLFCRARKIACAPPVPGSAEKRCNQCARREIDCEYPKESRRGHYRRLQYLERIGKAVEEKIAQVEEQSLRASGGERQCIERRDRRLTTASQPY